MPRAHPAVVVDRPSLGRVDATRRAVGAPSCVALVVLVLIALPGLGRAHPVPAFAASAGGSLTWTDLTPSLSHAPPAMNGEELRYDPGTHSVILFGGYNNGNFPDATWSFTKSGWTELSPSQSPPSENLGVMAYDSTDHYLVLFGGNDPVTSNTGPTWTYSSGTWTELSPTIAPPGRANAMMAYDAHDGYVLLFGGCGPPNTEFECRPLGDTWTYHAGVWTNLTPTLSTAPSPRWDAAIEYSPSLGGVVLFGGCIKTEVSGGVCTKAANDLWEFKSGQWTELSRGGSSAPAARYGSDLVYFPAARGLVLFSGSEANNTLLDDTWVLEGSHWTPATLTSGSPPATFRVRMADAASAGELVLFGGTTGVAGPSSSDTWVLT